MKGRRLFVKDVVSVSGPGWVATGTCYSCPAGVFVFLGPKVPRLYCAQVVAGALERLWSLPVSVEQLTVYRPQRPGVS